MVMHAFLNTLEVRQVDLFEFQNSQSHIVRQCLKLKKTKHETQNQNKTKGDSQGLITSSETTSSNHSTHRTL